MRASVDSAAWKCLVENGIFSAPVDLDKIIERNGWLLLNYQDHESLIKYLDKANVRSKVEGFVVMVSTGHAIICYDKSKDIRRKRFAIAHEIGHIVLSHTKDISVDRMEEEADQFAARLLMLISVINRKKLEQTDNWLRFKPVSNYKYCGGI